MIMSWQCTLGNGTSKSELLPEAMQDECQRLNFLGHPELTRFMSFCALRETYTDDPQVLVDALNYITLDLQSCLREGINVTFCGASIRIRLACLAVKGDWPWLIECGNLVRHFRRAAKRHESDIANSGICHFCCAGYQGIPCSDPTPQAQWIETCGSAASMVAWEEPSPALLNLPHDPETPAMLYRPDLFHNWHLGIGQAFVAAALVIVSKMCCGSSIPKQFESLTTLWRSWCRSQWLWLPFFCIWQFLFFPTSFCGLGERFFPIVRQTCYFYKLIPLI